MGERGKEEDLGEVGEEAEADEEWRLVATGTGLEVEERGEDDCLGPPLDSLVLGTAGELAAAEFGEVEESILGVGGIAEENKGFQLDFADIMVKE